MPIFKYKTFKDAEKALWELEPDDNYFARIERLFKLASKMPCIRYPRGIFKFKKFEEANKHRKNIEFDHALAVQAKESVSD